MCNRNRNRNRDTPSNRNRNRLHCMCNRPMPEDSLLTLWRKKPYSKRRDPM